LGKKAASPEGVVGAGGVSVTEPPRVAEGVGVIGPVGGVEQPISNISTNKNPVFFIIYASLFKNG
jgi:hypothetical protein